MKSPFKLPKVNVDRWAWVVLAGTLVSAILGAGQLQSSNIYFVIYLREFQQSRSFTAWISAAQNTALCTAGPIVSFVLLKFGPRITMFTGSILMATSLFLASFASSIPYLIVAYTFVGAAQTFLTSSNLASISIYFRENAYLVTGFMLAGGGIANMVTGLELEWAVETFGWRGAMFVQSGIVLQICVCASLVFRIRPQKAEPKTGGVVIVGATQSRADDAKNGIDSTSNRKSLKSLAQDPLFWLSVLAYLGVHANFSTMGTIFKGFVVSAGLESSFKAVLTTVGIANMAGRVLSGLISRLLCSPLHLTAIAITCAIANVLYILAREHWVLVVVGAAFGFCQGQMIVTWLLCISWVFGTQEMPVIRGYAMFFAVISSMSFPPIAGYTVDLTGNYNVALMMSALGSLCCAICGTATYIIHRRRLSAKRSYDVTELTKNNNHHQAKGGHYATSVSA